MSQFAVSNEDAITKAKCPKCRVIRGNPCVYMMPSSNHDSGLWTQHHKQLLRAGTPMKNVHNERRAVVAVRLRRRRLQEAVKHIPAQRLNAMQAVRQWETAEQIKLREWLIDYGSILWVRGSAEVGERSS